MIFVLIAGTYTPFALLVLHGTISHVVLIAVWVTRRRGHCPQPALVERPQAGHCGGLHLHRLGRDPGLPQLWDGLGPVGFGLIVLGGILYTAGAIVYARRVPIRGPPSSATTRSSTCW